MTKLTELLIDAAGDREPSSLDPYALAGEARRRRAVHRRRLLIAAAAAAVAAAMVAVPLFGGEQRRTEPAQEPGQYHDVVLSRAEMERRCTEVLNERNGTSVEYVAGRKSNGRAIPAERTGGYVETREGWAVELAPVGARWATVPRGQGIPSGDHITDAAAKLRLDPGANVCVIPQAGQGSVDDPQTSTIANDPHAIAEACSAAAGYDLTGWQVKALTTSPPGGSEPIDAPSLDALLMSSNGRAAHCWLQSGGSSGIGMIPQLYLDSSGQPVTPEGESDPSQRFSIVSPTVDSTMAIGVIPGLPDRWSIELAVGGSVDTLATTSDGAFAYHLSGPIGVPHATLRVRNAEGELVWEGPFWPQ